MRSKRFRFSLLEISSCSTTLHREAARHSEQTHWGGPNHSNAAHEGGRSTVKEAIWLIPYGASTVLTCCWWWWWLESCKLLSWCCLDVRLWPRAEIPVWAWLRDNVSVFKYRAGLPWGSRSVLKRPHDTGSLRRWPSVLECGSKSKEILISGSTTFYSWCPAQPLSCCHLFEVNSAFMQVFVFCFWSQLA